MKVDTHPGGVQCYQFIIEIENATIVARKWNLKADDMKVLVQGSENIR